MPGPGRPVTVSISDELVRAMQKVAAKTALWPMVPGVPVRVIEPVLLLVKHGTAALSEQHACEMPPLASRQEVPDPEPQSRWLGFYLTEYPRPVRHAPYARS